MSPRPPPIYVRLRDGLGNQLFQYALGRALATSLGTNVVFDTSWFDEANSARRPLALPDFAVRGEFRASPDFQRFWIPRRRLVRLWWRFEQCCLPLHWRHFVAQRSADLPRRGRMFDPRVLRVRAGTYLAGWWISPLYFAGTEPALRADLQLRAPLSPRAREAATRMQDCASVSVHVRRGDYINHPDIGMLGPNYYRRAIDFIRQRIARPRFFLFSDDPPGALAMLNALGADTEIVELEPGASPAMTLAAMAACRHHINANSTFSWWAAWLNPEAGKTVVVPEHWYAGAKVRMPDVYPPEWIRLPE